MSSIDSIRCVNARILIERMFARDRAALVAKPSERHMWTKRPFIRLPKGLKQGRAKLRELLAGNALRPQKAWASWLRTIADMAECERESDKPIGHATKFRDGVGYRDFIPWRHQREMNVGRRHRANGKLLQIPAILRKRQRNIGRDPQRHENPHRPNAGCRFRYTVDIVWRLRRDHGTNSYSTCDSRGEVHHPRYRLKQQQ